MKKLLLSFALLSCLFSAAQENWTSVEQNGFTYGATFRFTQVFQNKIYVAADTMSSILLYSSATGNTGSYLEETALKPVLHDTNELQLNCAVADNNYLFMGTLTNYDTLGGRVTPQVYRYDGTNYVKHGTINYTTPPSYNNAFASIERMALYSPTGSNDSIYVFVNTSGTSNITIWKAPAGGTNPTWVNTSNFLPGVGHVFDAQVWHKKLYVTAKTGNGGIILCTANGVKWDTVTSTSALQSTLGAGYYNQFFESMEVFHDTLIAGLANSSQTLWYTVDSVAMPQTWKTFIDSARYGNITNSWFHIPDMQVGDGKLWLQVNYSNQHPQVFVCTKNALNKDTLLSSSTPTGLESGQNFYDGYRMSYFNNSVYSTGYHFMGSRVSNSNQSMGGNAGNIWRFTTINPTAAFIDSVAPTTGHCAFNTIYLVNKSQNAASWKWYKNGFYYSGAKDTMYSTNKAEVDTFKLVAYNGTTQSLYKDSITQTVTIYDVPNIGPANASSYTVCQGQPDTLTVTVMGGTRPYTYVWHNVPDNLSYNGDSVSVITLYTVPQFSPYVYMYLSVTDANQCSGGNAPNLNIYVNAADTLSGVISEPNLSTVIAGQVYLFQKKMNHVGVADSAGKVNIGANGTYSFPGLYYGDYFLKAIADTNNILYKTSVGTYYSNKVNAYQWDSAIVIQQHTCTGGNNSGKNVTIIEIPVVASGPGTITGEVTEGPFYGQRYAHGGGYAPMGAPLKGVDVKLGKNPGGTAAARTTTDNSGQYSFHNVPLGSYKIYVDIPNYGMDSVRAIVLDSTVNLSVHNDYYVDSSMVRVVPTYSASAAICAGDSIMLQGAYQKTAGLYYDTLQASAGYDSLVATSLSITPLPTVSVTANTFTVCSGSNVTLTASGTASYQWSSNAGSVTTATASVNPITQTVYTITGSTNGCSDTKTISINTNALPNVIANTSLDSVCAGANVTLSGTGANTYTWSSGVSNGVAFTPTITATYTVTGTDNNTCVNTATVIVVVKNCIGIKQIAAAGLLSVYPNPASGTLFLEVEKNAIVKIYDITAQLVLELPISIGKNEINVSSLAPGAYDLMLNANGNVTYVKLMISK